MLLLLACARLPAPCERLCADFVLQQGACLEARGLDWPAAGYADADEAQSACETWAWEMALLARDAGCPDAVSAECAARESALEAVDCPDELDWNEAPASWETCDA